MHAGIICKIGEISKHSNADSLYITKLFGTQIIIKDDVKEGDIGIYFNSDLQLSQEFCDANKLLRKAHGGYIDDSKRNVRALKLRGEISDGLWLRLSSLEHFGDTSKLQVGQHISEFNGKQIACKYVPVQKEERIRTNTPKQKGSNSSIKVKYPLFVEHIDTLQYDYNKHRLQVGDYVEITLKLHGCFTSDTRIKKWNESKAEKMSKIKIGDTVVGYDEINKKYVPAKVTNVFINGTTNDWMEIHITRRGYAGEKIHKIKCTPNHRFYIDGEYIEASNLKIGQKVKTAKDTLILTKNQKSVLLGLALGDGSITHRSHASKVEFSHKKDHEELLDYEMQSLGNIASDTKQYKTSDYGTEMACAKTLELASIKQFIDSIFIDRHSFIEEELKANLDEVALAFLYLSDGSLAHSEHQEDRANIAICSFDDKNAKLIVDTINNNFGLNAVLYKDSRGYNRCRFNKDCANKLFDIIERYIPVCCRYKLPKDYQFSNIEPINLYSEADFGYIDIENEVVFIGNPGLKRAKKYDIETSTHNYVVGNSLVHNSSARVSNSLKKTSKMNWLRKLLKLNPKIENTWDYVSGTRRVVLKSNGEDSFYKDTFRKNWHNFFVGKLHKGETVFSEIVGFLDSGKPIMPSADNKKVNDKSFVKQFGDKTIYSYGCQENENDMYVYRMTLTNEDGHCIEYSPEQMRQRCEQIGVKTVPVLWTGVITDLDEFDKLVTELSDGVDPVGKTHIREGIIIRKLNSPTIEVLKKKGQTFKILENLVKDSVVLDMEEAESLETQEF